MRWPLRGVSPAFPDPPGAFGAVRRHDVHTGVDLYCPEGTGVVAVEPGQVVAIVPFTGPEAESPWWEPTDAVLVEGDSGVWLYGEVRPGVRPGDRLAAGDPVGTVTRVLRHDKGLPTVMLHVERYVAGTRAPVWWRHGEPLPEGLLDPTPLLAEAAALTPRPGPSGARRRTSRGRR